MIIHPVQIQQTGSGFRAAARIEGGPAATGGTELFYEVAGIGSAGCSGTADAFATALVLPAMMAGERVEIRGAVSRRLLEGLKRYQQIFHEWFPRRFAPVDLVAEPLDDARRGAAAGVGCAFSGGVDSSYTLLTHLGDTSEPGPIRYGVFVHGFDIPLENRTAYDTAAATYRSGLAEIGVGLIEVRTNLRVLADAASWELAHGSALGSVALLLDRLLGRFYVPASFPDPHLPPWGSHPLTDPLMSTETLEIVHDGCIPRIDKVAHVAEWPLARRWLRVCWERPHGSRNCCRCCNCVLTMVALELAGRLQDCPTFPEPLERARLRRLVLPEEDLDEVESVDVARALAAGREDLAKDLRHIVRRSRRRLAWRRWLRA